MFVDGQIFFGLLILPVEELGFVSFDVPNWQLLNGLGQGRFSAVFSCRHVETDEVFVMKVFRGDTRHMAETERTVLQSLSEEGVANIPSVQEFHFCDSFSALILTPLGVSVLPCRGRTIVTPAMLVALLQVVQGAHRSQWIHRDIKPDNIYLDQRDSSRIVLNDWSSAARPGIECDYVGTRLFGDRPRGDRKHTPDARLDLRCLVKTAFCLSKQYVAWAEDNDSAVQQHWGQIEQQFPTFQMAMAHANAVDYEALRTLLGRLW